MTLFDAISAQEKRILRLLRRLEDGTAVQPSQRLSLVDEVGSRLRGLLRIERDTLHPLLPDGADTRELVGAWRGEQREIEVALDELEASDPEAVSFQSVAEHLTSLVRHYVREDRRDLLRHAADSMQADRAAELGRQLEHRAGA